MNIPFTLTQGGMVQEALAVTFANNQRSNPSETTPNSGKIRRTDGMEWKKESGSEILGNRYDSYQIWFQFVLIVFLYQNNTNV